MSLDLKASITIAVNTEITVLDTTLAYSATNTGGYGTPNPAVGDFTDAALVLHLIDTETLLPSDTDVVQWDGASTIAFYPDFPNTGGIPFVITPVMAGYLSTEKLPDGIYQIDYEITDGESTYTYSDYILNDQATKCCLANLAEKEGCGCENKKSNFDKGWAALEAAQAAMLCQNITNAAKSLQSALSLCLGCGCGCS